MVNNSIPSHNNRSALMYLIFMSILALLACIAFYIPGKIPVVILVIVSISVAILATITAIWRIRIETPVFLRRYQKQAVFASILTVIILIIIVLMSPSIRSLLSAREETPAPIHYTPVLNQEVPFCNYSGGTLWSVPMSGTALSCTEAGLLMQPTLASNYAELDLNRVNNNIYSVTNFRVYVHITFQHPAERTTYAGVFFRTTEIQGIDGYIVTVNAAGQWQLRKVINQVPNAVVATSSINLQQGQELVLSVVAHDGELSGTINSQALPPYKYSGSLQSLASTVGLIVYRSGANQSSAVTYSDFELDEA